MSISRIKLWVWVVIGLLVGLAYDQVERLPRGDWKESYGTTIAQWDFEIGLRAPAGHKPFKNLVIYKEVIGDLDGGSKTAFIVVGDHATSMGGWEQRCFISDSPYRSLRFGLVPNQTFESVAGYLDTLGKTDPTIRYRHAWWRGTRAARALWAGLGVLSIGLVWPAIINLIVYKRLLRPREPKGISLIHVKGSSDKPAAEMLSAQDAAKTRELVEKIEAELAVGASQLPQEPAKVQPAPAPVVALTATPLGPATGEGEHASREFGKTEDDFYPTEVHTHHPHEPAKGPGGFSLVELLVVIGIISLLLGLLLPALSGFRQRAREVHCQATLRNLGFAAQLHANDHRGRLPLGGWQFNPVGGIVNPAGVGDADEKYYMYYTDAGIRRPVPITASLATVLGVKFRLDSRANLESDLQRDSVRNLFRCWSQEPQGKATSMGDGMGWSPPAEWSSYIFNEALLARRNQPWDFPQGHMSKVKRPGRVMFAMDANPRDFLMVFDMNTNYTMWDFHNLVLDQPQQYGPEPIDFPRHRYRANVLFCDWHVESLPLTQNGLKAIGVSNGIYE